MKCATLRKCHIKLFWMKNPVLSITRVPQIVYLHTNMNIQKHTLCHCTLFLSLYINKYVCLSRIYTPILWPPRAKSWLIGKDPDAGRDWGQEEKGMTEDEIVGWHHWLDGHQFEWTPGVGDGQGGLACCDSWGRKEEDTTERLNWTDGWFLMYDIKPQNYIKQISFN